ncbi:MAG: 16S rRNA (cytosine(967)-C(5))-methyltransferase RsmB [Oscillospiraceae bacterium]|nr:16S rRNA (cytosine(967)-C(5))-methyltransferase RsmB [Oscillospiraceae bacterium]
MTGREAAARALTAFERSGAWSDAYLDGLIRNEGMDRREAALAARLCGGVLQNRALCDSFIEPYIRKKLDTQVRQILRTAVYQLAFTRIPARAAVNEAVELTKKLCNSGAASLVNAVLRRLLSDGLPQPPGGDDTRSMAVRYSHPPRFIDYFKELIGTEKTKLLLEADNAVPETSLRVNRIKSDPEKALGALRAEGVEARAEGEFIYTGKIGRISELKAFTDGLVTVQDASAALAVEFARLRPGMKVLDACAAPGGKSFLAAQIMNNSGSILSCDIYSSKLADISEGAERLGAKIISVRRMDASKPDPELNESFDAVLADVPCSGMGVIRKKPEIRYKSFEDIAKLPELQLKIADNLAAYVRKGGVLLYSTCTLIREENEGVTEAFIAAHGEFVREEEETIWPFERGTDGFYICRLRKKT